MSGPDFPDELRDLIRGCIPDVDAVEILLFLSRNARERFEPSSIAKKVRAELPEDVVRRHLSRFVDCRLLRQEGTRYRFAPAETRLRGLIRALERLYNERPVTLVRAIYTLRTDPVRAFSDAFKLQRR
jgi:hypothetical protein